MNQEILDYIKAAKEHGLADTEIKQSLLNAGWEVQEVENNFAHFAVRASGSAQNKDEDMLVLSKVMQGPAKSKEPLNPTPSLSPSVITEPAKASTNHFKWYLRPLGVIAVLILAAGGYYAYAFGVRTPNQVWNEFSKKNQPAIYNSTLTLSYNDDKVQLPEGKDELLGIKLKNINLKMEGSGYFNSADPKNIESNADFQYMFGSGSTNFSTGIKVRQKGPVMYLSAGSNPILDVLIQAVTLKSGKNTNLEWIKLDTDAVKKSATVGSSDQGFNQIEKVFNRDFLNELKQMSDNAKLVRVKKLMGWEKINGVNTWHFQNELDTKALKDLASAYLDKFVKAFVDMDPNDELKQPSAEDLELAHFVANGLIDKIEVKNFETWIGAKDAQLHKVVISSNFPSILSLINSMSETDISPARASSRDKKRISDMESMQFALEEYKNYYGGYPESIEGRPVGMTPEFMEDLPNPPEPADGQCSKYYNTYWYTAKGDKSVKGGKTVYPDYSYDFCVGGLQNNQGAGIAQVTPQKINYGLPCRDTVEHCSPETSAGASEKEKNQEAVKQLLARLQFSAQLSLNEEFSEFGVIRAVDEPKEFFDLTSIIVSNQIQARDFKRSGDISSIKSALGTYYRDKNKFPKELAELSPLYISAVPAAPLPNDGQCSESDNTYSYSTVGNNPQDFALSFCLGALAGDMAAGRHTLSVSGIK